MKSHHLQHSVTPSCPFQITVNRPTIAQKHFDAVKLGHYFLFHTQSQPSLGDRLARLLVNQAAPNHRVVPLVEGTTQIAGMTFTAKPRQMERLACLVGDRALLREDEDTLNLCAVVPGDTSGITLEIRRFGEVQEQSALTFTNGMAAYQLEHPPSGSYEAELRLNNQSLGKPFAFEVAGYQLAPLSATLDHFEIQADQHQLSFQLSVESYQQPFHAPLLVRLTQNEVMLSQTQLKINAQGRYQGTLPMPAQAEAQLVLDMSPIHEPNLNAQVVVPGSRGPLKPTVLNEFGQNRTWSTLPQPRALSIRGGYLGEGQWLETPVLVDQTITDHPELLFLKDAVAVHLVIHDLQTGTFTTKKLGDVAAGAKQQVALNGCAAVVTVGCFFEGRPFEGYTTFIKPNRLELALDIPETLKPGDTLTVKLQTGRQQPVPVLVWACDRRLIAPQLPDIGLAEHLRDIINAQAEAMAQGCQGLPAALKSRLGMPSIMTRPRLKKRSNSLIPSSNADFEADCLSEGASGALCDNNDDDLWNAVAGSIDGGMFDGPPGGIGGAAQPRERFPESLYFGVTTVTGNAEIAIPLGDSLTVYRVQAFALHDGDWFRRQQDVVVDLPVRVDLDLPEAVTDQDQVQGKLVCHAASGRALVSLRHNDQAVSLVQNGARVTDTVMCPAVLTFDVAPGRYEATIRDAADGTSDSVVHFVDSPGCFTTQVKQTSILTPGEQLDLESCDAVAIRLLPSLAGPTATLMEATADYSFLCCEQTAAKNLAAAFMWLTATDPKQRHKAALILRKGLARQITMFVAGAGFSMYPDSKCFSQYYGALAVRYIWLLRGLAEVENLPHGLRGLLQEVLTCADQAGAVYNLQPSPAVIETAYDAYAAAQAGRTMAAKTWLDQTFSGQGRLREAASHPHQVQFRSDLAVAAATYLKLGDLRSALPLCNRIFAAQTDAGRLYSTQDSIAAVIAAVELAKFPDFKQPRRLIINGTPCDSNQAETANAPIEVLALLEGFAIVEITRWVEEDWLSFGSPFPVAYEWQKQGRKTKHLKAGTALDLCIRLPEGYIVGDLAHISLPPGICRRVGGGQVRRFSVDFAGAAEIQVPVVVTATQRCLQHLLICVRNMFEEERGSCAGFQKVLLNGSGLSP